MVEGMNRDGGRGDVNLSSNASAFPSSSNEPQSHSLNKQEDSPRSLLVQPSSSSHGVNEILVRLAGNNFFAGVSGHFRSKVLPPPPDFIRRDSVLPGSGPSLLSRKGPFAVQPCSSSDDCSLMLRSV